MSLLEGKKIGFIGSGNMAEAIARGLINSGKVRADDIMGSDPFEKRREVFASFGARTTSVNEDAVEFADVVVLATKPQVAADMLAALKITASVKEKIFVSIMAGKTIGWIQKYLGNECKIVRVMPNTPLMVGEGATGIVGSKLCSEDDTLLVKELFSSCGVAKVFEKESALDSVTAVSGSGPAYVFRLIEGMVAGGVEDGLDEESALELAIQTVIGAGKLAKKGLSEGRKPGTLREMVTSKKGTTEAALNYFKENHLFEIVKGGVLKAANRSRELAKE